LNGEQYECNNSECSHVFPIVNDTPILIDERSSIFTIDDFVHQRNTFFDLSPRAKIKRIVKRFVPEIGQNLKGRKNYDRLEQSLLSRSNGPTVLVVGGSIVGEGMEHIVAHPCIELVETDVSFGPRTALICDAHSIPFQDCSFDGIIVQAVLEHVVDPQRCVAEIHRTLKDDGLVYAEIPFMQQVHAGRYDFTRFTHLGLRRLFRRFEEIDSGAVGGPGMALAWSYTYLLRSFTESPLLVRIMDALARFTSFYIKYLDYLLIDKAGSLDAASGYYFFGRKGQGVLQDKELIKRYRGLFR
jgi:SAM-dependent methyltransferase